MEMAAPRGVFSLGFNGRSLANGREASSRHNDQTVPATGSQRYSCDDSCVKTHGRLVRGDST